MSADISTEQRWWSDAAVYQVYLRSFQDSDGDGIGDLAGVASRMDHIASLGVDAVWLTPFFPSPGLDHGYDVSDYLGVDPMFGDLETVERVISRAHEAGLRVLADVVPNHTSDQHPWFQAALREGAGGTRYRPYYIWRDPAPDGGVPNNWRANFGGPSWTLDRASGQYFQHSYLPEQPELNWRHPPVREEFQRILEYWLARGVDGFRIDVAHNLLKHPDFPDNPPVANPAAGPSGAARGRVSAARAFRRLYDIDQDDCPDLFIPWSRDLPDTRRGERPFLLGETVLHEAPRTARYIQPGRLDAAMWFGLEMVGFDAEELAASISAPLRARSELPAGSGSFGWFLSNHDRERLTSRLGSTQRALALSSAVLALPGPFMLYQGEEIGMEHTALAAADAQDPIAVRAQEPQSSRDGARTPIPWDDAPGRGFSSAAPWLVHGPLPADGSLTQQTADDTSVLQQWRGLLHTWQQVRADLPATTDVRVQDGVLIIRRGRLRVLLNTAGAPRPCPVGGGQLLWSSAQGGAIAGNADASASNGGTFTSSGGAATPARGPAPDLAADEARWCLLDDEDTR